MIRVSTSLTVATLLLILTGGSVFAQQIDTAAADTAALEERGQGSGRVSLTGWPSSLRQLLDEMGRRAPYLLPKIDSLALDYRYAADDSTSQWSFVLGWQPGNRVLHEGTVVSRRKAPSNIRMVNVELRAEVRVDGEYVGDLIVAVDSMALAPFPSIYSFEVRVGHERVLLDAPAATARQALLKGATLEDIVVERMGFVSDAVSTSERRAPDVRERQPAPRPEPSIYESTTRIFIGWRVAPRPYYVTERDGNRRVQPRDEAVGRGATRAGDTRTRTAGRGASEGSDDGGSRSGEQKSSSDDDDDEDETSLRLPALGAVAAVGLLAYAGGTVGLYGRGDTPIGLAAGYTHPRGGVQFHAAVNGAVIEGAPGQKLTLKALGFYDVFSSHVQPAVGLGLQVDPQREGDVVPSMSLGLAGNFGRIVAFAGVDVLQVTPEIGLAYNFRYGRGREAGEGKAAGK